MAKKMIWSSIDEKVRKIVNTLADRKGVTVSEYIRQLILKDLDERHVFTSKIKEEIV